MKKSFFFLLISICTLCVSVMSCVNAQPHDPVTASADVPLIGDGVMAFTFEDQYVPDRAFSIECTYPNSKVPVECIVSGVSGSKYESLIITWQPDTEGFTERDLQNLYEFTLLAVASPPNFNESARPISEKFYRQCGTVRGTTISMDARKPISRKAAGALLRKLERSAKRSCKVALQRQSI